MKFKTENTLYNQFKSSKFKKNSFWLILDQIIRTIISIIVSSLVARYFGVVTFGDLNFIIIYVTFFQILANFGSDTILAKELIENEKHSLQILKSLLLFRLFFSVIILLFSFVIYYYFFNQNSDLNLFLVIGSSIFFLSFNVFESFYISRNNFKITTLIKLLAFIIANLLKLIFLYFKLSVLAFGLLYTIEYILIASIYYLRLNQLLLIPFQFKRSFIFARTIFKKSYKFGLSAILIMIYSRLDLLYMKANLGGESVGLYISVLNISNLLPAVALIFHNAALPILSKLKISDTNSYVNYSKIVVVTFGLIGFILSLIVYLSSDLIVTYIYGSSFFDSIEILKLYVWSNVFIFVGVGCNLILIIENLSHISLYRSVLGIIFAVLFNYIFIGKYMAIGAAFSFLFTQFIVTSYVLYRLKYILFSPNNVRFKSK